MTQPFFLRSNAFREARAHIPAVMKKFMVPSPGAPASVHQPLADRDVIFSSKAYVKDFQKHLLNGTIEGELKQAIAYVSQHVSVQPIGATCQVRDPADLFVQAKTSPILTGGSLAQLHLRADAVSTLDGGRIAFLMNEYTSGRKLLQNVGNIAISNDSWDGTHQVDLHRLNKDAEVHVLCLYAYWLKNDSFNIALADLKFEYQAAGFGSDKTCSTLRMIDTEEKNRYVSAMSGWRRMELYVTLSEQLVREQLYPDVASDADRLIKHLVLKKLSVWNINAETMGRYLALGRRCKKPLLIGELQK